MLNNEIWYNGIPSRQAGVKHVEHYPNMNRPERLADVFTVPGRNGSIIFPSDSFGEIIREYDIFAGEGGRGTAPPKFVTISEWLNSAGGAYAKLEDSYEPEYFRLAYCLGGYEAESDFDRYGRATISFNCRPERFLKAGEKAVKMAPGDILRNPTGYASKPLISLKGAVGETNSHLVFRSGGKSYHIFFEIDPTIQLFIDCETMDCYDVDGRNRNDYISVDEFPQFHPGNVEYYDNGVMEAEVTVIPRWFVI